MAVGSDQWQLKRLQNHTGESTSDFRKIEKKEEKGEREEEEKRKRGRRRERRHVCRIVHMYY